MAIARQRAIDDHQWPAERPGGNTAADAGKLGLKNGTRRMEWPHRLHDRHSQLDRHKLPKDLGMLAPHVEHPAASAA
jgi:hypothetical protein